MSKQQLKCEPIRTRQITGIRFLDNTCGDKGNFSFGLLYTFTLYLH